MVPFMVRVWSETRNIQKCQLSLLVDMIESIKSSENLSTESIIKTERTVLEEKQLHTKGQYITVIRPESRK